MEQDSSNLVQTFVRDETFGLSTCQYSCNYAAHIAKGAFGIVYQATIVNRGDFRGAEHVAVKVIHFDRQPESVSERTKWAELRQRLLVHKLSHDHLVANHKVTISKGSLGGISIELMMDYHNGGDLSRLLRNLRQQRALMSKADAASYAIQTAEGLQFLHGRQIIHGDLKPSNILTTLSSNGDRKLAICDLDDIIPIERDATCSHDITHLRGTVRYMSPEMLKKFVATQDSGSPGRKTDIWSLGCIMLELAGCVVGNDQKWLCKEHQRIEVGNKVNDERYIHLIIEGYFPCAIETVPSCLNASFQQCLHTTSSERISLSLLIKRLKAREFIVIFRYTGPGNECYVFDPLTKSATQLTLPADLHKNVDVLAFSNGSVVGHTVQGSPEIMVWDVQNQTCPTILFPERRGLREQMLCPIAVMDKIYFWCKMGDSVQFRMLELCDGTDIALQQPPNFPPILRFHGTRDGSRIIFIGEKWAEQHSLPMWVKCFDTVTGEWESLPDLPAWRCGFAMVVLLNTVYVLGGTVSGTNRRSCLRLDLQSPTRQWDTMGELLEGRTDHCAFISDNMMYVFGGRPGKVPASGIMEVYDVERDLWSTVSVTGSKKFFENKFGLSKYKAANVTLSWPVSGSSQ